MEYSAEGSVSLRPTGYGDARVDRWTLSRWLSPVTVISIIIRWYKHALTARWISSGRAEARHAYELGSGSARVRLI